MKMIASMSCLIMSSIMHPWFKAMFMLNTWSSDWFNMSYGVQSYFRVNFTVDMVFDTHKHKQLI